MKSQFFKHSPISCHSWQSICEHNVNLNWIYISVFSSCILKFFFMKFLFYKDFRKTTHLCAHVEFVLPFLVFFCYAFPKSINSIQIGYNFNSMLADFSNIIYHALDEICEIWLHPYWMKCIFVILPSNVKKLPVPLFTGSYPSESLGYRGVFTGIG